MNTLERLKAELGAIEFSESERESADGIVTVDAPLSSIPELMKGLKERCGFSISTFVTAVDYYPGEPRFEMAWQFQSVEHSDRVRVHTKVFGEDPKVPTITHLWPGAAYSERECYDLLGIVFEGHEELRRILMPDAYEYHPLRKDFPQQGIEPQKLYEEWDVKRRQPVPTEES
jgi:NADH:ubiquinone oxidoreductase subunit C